MSHESARPCGCDPGANWTCEVHRELEHAGFHLAGAWLASGRPITSEYINHPARQALIKAKRDFVQERSTSYLVRLRDKHTGQSFEAAFNSMTERTLYILSVDHWAELEKEWEA